MCMLWERHFHSKNGRDRSAVKSRHIDSNKGWYSETGRDNVVMEDKKWFVYEFISWY